jgi:tetratricopeptide (TPR) repeat protein
MPNERGLHKQLGRVFQQQGRAEEAIAEFDAELRLAPADFLSLDALGDLHQAGGRTDLAVRMWEAAMLARPESEPTALKLARAHVARGSEDDARRVMRAVSSETTVGSEARELMLRLGL